MKDEETKKEVQQMLEPYFKLEREIWQEETEERLKNEITEQVTKQVTERVTEEVTERVTEEVTEQLTKEIAENGMKKMIHSLKNCGVSRENTKKQLMTEYELSETDAEEKMKLYFV